MAKQERKIVRWITVNEARVPIFEGQTADEAFKEHISKDRSKQAGKKTTVKKKAAAEKADTGAAKKNDGYPSEQEMRDYIKSKGKEKFVKELSGNTERGYQAALRNVYDQETLSPEEYGKKYFGKDYKYKGDKAAAKTDGGESKRLGIYKKQLADVQEDIEQFESTPKSLRSKDYDQKLGELKKKERDLKGWIDNDINARRNESVKEKQLAANKKEADMASAKQDKAGGTDNVHKIAEALGVRRKDLGFVDKMTNGYRVSTGTRDEKEAQSLVNEIKSKTGIDVELRKRGGYGAKSGSFDVIVPFAGQEKKPGISKESANAKATAGAKKDRMQAASNNLERKLADSLKKYNRPNADKEAYNLIEAYKKGQIEPERLTMWGLSKDELKSLSAQGKKEAEHDVASGRTKKKVIGMDGKIHTVDKKTAYEKNYGTDISRSRSNSTISKESAGAMSNVYDGGKKVSSKSDSVPSVQANDGRTYTIKQYRDGRIVVGYVTGSGKFVGKDGTNSMEHAKELLQKRVAVVNKFNKRGSSDHEAFKTAATSKNTAKENNAASRKVAAAKHESLMGSTAAEAKKNLASMSKGDMATICRKLGMPNSMIRSMDEEAMRKSLMAIYKGSHK